MNTTAFGQRRDLLNDDLTMEIQSMTRLWLKESSMCLDNL